MAGIYGERIHGDPIHAHIENVYKYAADVGTAWTQIGHISVSYFNRGLITFANINGEDSFSVKIYGSSNDLKSDPGGEVIGDGWINLGEINQSNIYASSDYNHNAEITVVGGKIATIPINISLKQIRIYAKGAVVDTTVKAFGYFMR